MKNLQLIPDIHRQQHIVKADFAFDNELIALIKIKEGFVGVKILKNNTLTKIKTNNIKEINATLRLFTSCS